MASEEARCAHVADVEATKARIMSDLALQASGMDDIQFVAIDCEGVPESLELLQVATEQGIYIFDAKLIGETTVCEALEPLLTLRDGCILVRKQQQFFSCLDPFPYMLPPSCQKILGVFVQLSGTHEKEAFLQAAAPQM